LAAVFIDSFTGSTFISDCVCETTLIGV
jgi:hypothetical protein